MELLEDLLATRADRETLAAFAKQSPQHHMAMTKVAAGLAGFADAQIITVQPLHEMSSMELARHIAEQWYKMGLVTSVEEGLRKIGDERLARIELQPVKDDAPQD